MCMSPAGSSNSSLIFSKTRFLTRACSLLQGFSYELKVDVSQYFITLCLFALEGRVVRAQFHQCASRGSEGTLELILSVYCVSPETQTQVVKLDGRPLKQLPVPNTRRKKYLNLLPRKR